MNHHSSMKGIALVVSPYFLNILMLLRILYGVESGIWAWKFYNLSK